jgi:hypothetical protein
MTVPQRLATNGLVFIYVNQLNKHFVINIKNISFINNSSNKYLKHLIPISGGKAVHEINQYLPENQFINSDEFQYKRLYF